MTRTQENSELQLEMGNLCKIVKKNMAAGNYAKCEELIGDAMRKYPHAAEPHNLIGVVLEKEGAHDAAMKHFRAASALDPSYRPALKNMEAFGAFFAHSKRVTVFY